MEAGKTSGGCVVRPIRVARFRARKNLGSRASGASLRLASGRHRPRELPGPSGGDVGTIWAAPGPPPRGGLGAAAEADAAADAARAPRRARRRGVGTHGRKASGFRERGSSDPRVPLRLAVDATLESSKLPSRSPVHPDSGFDEDWPYGRRPHQDPGCVRR